MPIISSNKNYYTFFNKKMYFEVDNNPKILFSNSEQIFPEI